MGQQAAKPSKSDPELGRIHEVFDLISLAFQQLKRLGGPAYAEEARGVPATPGSQQAQYAAAFEHLKRLFAERDAIVAHIATRRTGDPSPMPAPTPPFRPPPLPQQEAEPAPLPSECADKSEPSNPLSSAILHREQLGSSSCGTGSSSGSGSSSGGEAALPSNAECPESAPLLAAPARQLAPGLRRRPGNAGSETLY